MQEHEEVQEMDENLEQEFEELQEADAIAQEHPQEDGEVRDHVEDEQLDEEGQAEHAEEAVQEGAEWVSKIPKFPKHMTPAERKRLEEAATKRIGEERKTKKVHQLKVKELKAKDAYKLHVEKAGKAKTDMHMYDDKLKENKDLRKADVEESEGHFKLARKLDLEA